MTQRNVIHLGDCLDVLPKLDAESVDAVITDPPYALTTIKRFGPGQAEAKSAIGKRLTGGFMGMRWDTGDVAFDPATWELVLRVLKPGGHLLAFGGTRTYHRLACAVEDAGFEIRDQLLWLYGSGFPKSLDVSKAIDKAAGAQREVVRERYTVKRIKPGATIVAEGAWGKQEMAYTATDTVPATVPALRWQGWGTALKPAVEPIVLARKPLAERSVAAQVLATGTGAINVDACRIAGDVPACKQGVGREDGTAIYANGKPIRPESREFEPHAEGRWPANVILDADSAAMLDEQGGERSGRPGAMPRVASAGDGWGMTATGAEYDDRGGASRFFYTAKADTAERNEGLGKGERNPHPTVKPISVMSWLIRLVTPPGGVVLDPFLGSGTTAIAAQGCGFDWIGIEREPQYVDVAARRIGLLVSVVDHRPADAEPAA